MSEPNFGFDGARTEQELERWAAAATAKAERYQEMQQQVNAITASESSRDGLVTVTVDSAGAVVDLRITDGVRNLRGVDVAAAVLDTMRRAQARITGQVAEVMQRTVGDDPQTVEAVVAGYRQRFPEPEPEPGPGRRRDVVRDKRIGDFEDEDDDWGGNPFGRR